MSQKIKTSVEIDGSLTANSIVKSGGTSYQILAANGSVVTAGSGVTISGGIISASGSAGVTSFNTRTGAVTLISSDVTTALGYTPYNASNPAGYISSYTETDTLATVTGRGSTTTSNVTVGSLIIPSFETASNVLSFRSGIPDGTNVGIRAKAITTANRDGLELLGYNGIDFSTNNGATVAMRISIGGNVHVGGSSSSYKFHVAGGQYGTYLKGGDLGTGSDILRLVDASNNTKYLARGDGKHFFTGDTDVSGNLTASGITRLGGSGYKTYIEGGLMFRDYGNNTLTNGRFYYQDDAWHFRGGGEGEADVTSDTAMYIRSGNIERLVLHDGNISSYAVPSSRTITINGTSYDLSANRSWTVTANAVETDTLATVVARGDITNGGRPIRLDTSGGGVSIRGSAGGWATGYYFMGGPSNTYRGGFGALGDNDNLTNYWIGPAYNNFYTYIDASQMTHTSSMRAPVFYDSQDTAYYVNPGDASRIRKTDIVAIGSGWYDALNIYSSDATNKWSLLPDAGASNSLRFAYNAAERFRVQTNGSVISLVEHQSPIYYDFNNTAYYLNPDGTSRINTINLDTLRGPQGDWLLGYQSGTTYSFGSTAVSDALNIDFNSTNFANGSNWFGGYGSGSGPGLSFENQNTFARIVFWGLDFYDWNNGTQMVIDNGYVSANNSFRAPIFYDSNNTGYYVDPASTSNLNGLTVAGTISGNVSGTARKINIGSAQTITDLNISVGDAGSVMFDTFQSAALNKPVSGNNANGVLTFSMAHGPQYGKQIAFADDDDLYIRRLSANSYASWRKILHSGNYTSFNYFDMPYGGNEISGMGPITNWDSRPGVGMAGFGINWHTGVSISGYGGYGGVRLYASGYPTHSGSVLRLEASDSVKTYGTFTNDSSVRSPIFYDSNDTTYYVDPAGSATRAAFLNGNLWINPKSESYGEGIAFNMPAQGTWGGLRWYRNGPAGNYAGNWAFGYFGNESNNDVGFHNGTNGWRLDHSFNMTATGSVRSPIFYDNNDTGYYLDPNSISRLSAIDTGAADTYNQFRSWTNLTGHHGFYSSVHNSAHFYPNNGTYGAWKIDGNRNGWGGIEFGSGNGNPSLMISADSNTVGFHNNSYGWQIRWAGGTLYSGRNAYGGNDSIVLQEDKWINSKHYGSDGAFYSTVFYDSNNSAYYVNPDSTSRMYYINADYLYSYNYVYAQGDVIAYYSDERLKDRKGNIKNALDKVLSLNGFYYTNNETAKENGYDEDNLQIGLSAQEVQSIAPEIVTLAPFDTKFNEDGSKTSKSGKDYLTVNYNKVVPILVEAIKEQQTQIEELKELVNKLINKK